jgi:hypothetical protein
MFIRKALKRAGVNYNELPSSLQKRVDKEQKAWMLVYSSRRESLCPCCCLGPVRSILHGHLVYTRDELQLVTESEADELIQRLIRHHALDMKCPGVFVCEGSRS